MNLKLAWNVLADTFSKWNEHKAIRLGAALKTIVRDNTGVRA